MRSVTVRYDASRPPCRRAREWLLPQQRLVALSFVAAASEEVWRRFPALDHSATLGDLTGIGDDGAVYPAERAWVLCLWCRAEHGMLAERLSSPVPRPWPGRRSGRSATTARSCPLCCRARVGPVAEGTTARSRSSKGEQTRELILVTALRLFREQGYDATTMRAIAAEAAVSVGNAYYYFDSKEHLIQAFYDDIGRQHRASAAPLLAGRRELADRLRTSLTTHLDVMAPYHDFAGGFFKTAADPKSPLSPFSSASAPARGEEVAFCAALVDGSDANVPKGLREELPDLLWLYHMGVVLYWVHDSSEGAERTYQLVHRTAPLVVRLIGLARVPLLRSVVDDVVGLVKYLSGKVVA
jgi:AcrR family transcriptional regulator